MLRRTFVSLMIIAVVASMIGVGTFAVFSDTEKSSNNKFVAGSIDLEYDIDGVYYNGTDVAMFSIADIKPGYPPVERTISFHNKGMNPGMLSVVFNNVQDAENDIIEPEANEGGDVTAEGELSANLVITIWKDNGDNILQPYEEVLYSGPLYGLNQTISLGTLLPCYDNVMYLGVMCQLPAAVGNVVMTDSCTFDMVATLNQMP